MPFGDATTRLPAEPIRVLRVIARLNIGGPAIHVTLVTAGLDKNRYTSWLVTGTENPGEGSMVDYAHARGVHPVVIPEIVGRATLTPRDLVAFVKLYRLMRRLKPHIVHTHTAKPGFLGRVAARLAGVPVIVHTYHGHVLQGYYGQVKTAALRRMERWLARLSDQLVAVSRQVKRDLVSYGIADADRIIVVPLGLELSPYLDVQRHSGTLRREFGWASDEQLVGIVGRIFPIKNHALFLDAAARVACRLPRSRFVVVGDGVLREEMQQQAGRLGLGNRVVFTGWRRDLPRLYADLNVLVVSSENEGTPVSAIEAMASGCPVVATKVGGLTDLLDDGVTGLLVPPRDAEALADAIESVLTNGAMASAFRVAGRSSVRRRFRSDRLVADLEHLYEDLLKRRVVLKRA